MITVQDKILQLRKTAKPVETRAVEMTASRASVSDDGLTGSAYFMIWGTRDSHGTAFLKGSAKRSIDARGPGSKSNDKILMYWQHDPKDPIGQFTAIVEDDIGLRGDWVLDDPEAVPNAKRARAQIKSGTINQYSVGFDFIWNESVFEYDAETDTVFVKEIELHQMDPVSRASNSGTHTIRSVEDFENTKLILQDDIEDAIRNLPRKHQLEIRSLFSRQMTLAEINPDALRARTLELADHPAEPVINYSLFKIS